MSKRKIIIISIISFFTLLLAGIGIFIIVSLNKPVATITEKDTDLKNDTLEINSDTLSPENYDAYDVMSYTLWKMSHTDFMVLTEGSSNALGITQKVKNKRTVIGKEALITTVSTSSMKKVAKEKFIVGNGTVLLSDASSVDVDNATAVFSTDEPTAITEDDYIDMYGWLPFQLCGYIISKDTYLEEPKLTKLDDGTYQISLDLDPASDKAPFWYRREILTNSGSTTVPNFSSIHIEYIIDSQYRVLKGSYTESYNVTVFFPVDTTTSVVDTFTYDNLEFDKERYDFYSKYKGLVVNKDDNQTKTLSPITMLTNAFLFKKETFDMDLSINSVTTTGVLSLDLKSLNNVKVYATLKDDIYVEYNDYLYIKYGNIKLKGRISDILNAINSNKESSDKFDISSLTNLLSDMDMKTNIDGDKSYLLINTNLYGVDVAINLKFSDANGTTIEEIVVDATYSDLKINLLLKPTKKSITVLDKADFIDVLDASMIFDLAKGIIEGNNLEFDIDYSISNFSITGHILFDISKLELKANLEIDIYGSKHNIDLYYLSKYNNLNNVIFIKFDDIKIYFPIQDNNNDSEASYSSIFELILSDEVINLVSELNIDSNEINIVLNTDIIPEKIKNILGIEDKINIDILTTSTNGIDICIDNLNINLNLTTDTFEYDLSSYSDISNLVTSLSPLINNLFKESFEVDCNLKINDKLSIDAKAYLYLDNNKYNAKVNLDITYDSINVNLNIYYKDSYFYLSYGDINLKLTLNEIIDLVKYTLNKFNAKLESFDSIYNKLISNIKYEDNKFVITSNESLNHQFTLDVSISSGNTYPTINIKNNDFVSIINITNIQKEELVIEDKNYIEYNNLFYLVDIVHDIYNLVLKDNICFDINLDLYKDSMIYLRINGDIFLKRYIDISNDFDLELNITIDEYYQDGSIKASHKVKLIYLSATYYAQKNNDITNIDSYNDARMVYIKYGNSSNEEETINLESDLINIKNIYNTLNKFLKLDFNTITDSIDISNVDFSSYIKNIIIKENELSFEIPGSIISTNLETSSLGNIKLNTSNLLEASLINQYINYYDDNNSMMLSINQFIINDSTYKIEEDTKSNYYDVSELYMLVDGIYNLLDSSNFYYKGDINLSIISIEAASIPFSVKSVNGNYLIEFSTKESSVLSIVMERCDAKIYISNDGFVYIHKEDYDYGLKTLFKYKLTDTHDLKITLKEFSDNILYYILSYILEFSNYSSIADTSTDISEVPNAYEVFNNYSYSDNTFNISIDLGKAISNDSLGDLDLSINVGVDYNSLYQIDAISNLELEIVNIISISSTNIVKQDVILEESEIKTFIDNYSYETDIEYVDGVITSNKVSHKIKFICGLSYDVIEIEGYANDNIEFVSLPNTEYNGITYKFVGWYTDKNCKNEFSLTKFDNDSHTIYAKWEKE